MINVLKIRKFRFLISGTTAACLYFGVLYISLSLGVVAWLSALLAYFLAFIVGYTAQNFFTFQSEISHYSSLPRYIVLQAGCSFLAALTASSLERFGITHPVTISFSTTLILGIVSYFISSKWVFSK